MTRSDRATEDFKAAARRVFARQGYASTKITDITDEAGRAAGGMYRYFDSKAALLKALADDLQDSRRGHIVHVAGDGHTMTTEADVRDHVQAYLRTYRDHLPEMVAISEAAASDPQFADIRAQIRATDVRIWRDHIAETRAHVGKPASDAAEVALMVVCLLELYCYNALHLGTAKADVDALAAFVYNGLTG
ncbi:TetR/AcrR family transcriptional regulator [Lentzea sp. CA-135723]|uniref:TetR/AcrR family transcriptional regulator n=1 Tax=Lentzea sp. CA-135723 TaxID=3239950 RepID=UPI003D94A19B